MIIAGYDNTQHDSNVHHLQPHPQLACLLAPNEGVGMVSEPVRATQLSCRHFSHFDVAILVRESCSRLGIGFAVWWREVRHYHIAREPPGYMRLPRARRSTI
jgi:hypothetical protein